MFPFLVVLRIIKIVVGAPKRTNVFSPSYIYFLFLVLLCLCAPRYSDPGQFVAEMSGLLISDLINEWAGHGSEF